MIKLTTIKTEPTNHSVQLPVTQSGMVVSCPGGPFKYGGEDFILQPTEYTAQDVAYPVSVHGWLAKAKSDGSPHLVVDENHEDGPFDWDESAYTQLDLLFHLHVPANTTTLDDVEITVRHLIPVERPAPQPEVYTDEELAAKQAIGEAIKAQREAEAQARADELATRRAEQAVVDDGRIADREKPEDQQPVRQPLAKE